jgi:hypothetical protein
LIYLWSSIQRIVIHLLLPIFIFCGLLHLRNYFFLPIWRLYISNYLWLNFLSLRNNCLFFTFSVCCST